MRKLPVTGRVETGRMSRLYLLLCLVGVTLSAAIARGASAPREPVSRRKQVFEFTQKPSVTRRGDKVTVTFASKGHCDATVAVENAEREIVRHLAGGVLGPNAPLPFQKNSLKQTVVWDGKDDQGRYVDDVETHSVRVSLGLQARFERTLFWSPKRRTRSPVYAREYQVLAMTPEGVYVYDGGNCLHLRLFDHQGKYVRTVFPPPRRKLAELNGLMWRTFPQDGARLPLKHGLPQYTFLTSGNLKWDGVRWPTGGVGEAASTMAAHGGKIALVNRRLNRLASDGSTPRRGASQAGRLPLAGPKTCITMFVPGVHSLKSGDYEIPPRSAAFSPDGKWLYLAGFRYHMSWRTGCTHAVYRLKYDSDEPMQLFKGQPYVPKRRRSQPGKDNDHFNYPASVDCDAQGRVYVADYLNDRVQVFAPDARHLKTIPVHKPTNVTINRKTGEIYVFSYVIMSTHFWYQVKELRAIRQSLKRFKSFDDPKPTGAWPLPKGSHGFPRGGGGLDQARIALDFHTDPPAMWALSANGPAVYEFAGGQWRRKFDFITDVRRTAVWTRGARHMKQRIYFNPRNRKLYVGDLHAPWPFHVTGFYRIPAVHTETGRVEIVDLPFDTEDLAMDINGRAYLRTANAIARYDPNTWREVPFDYGDSFPALSSQGLRSARVASAITFAGVLGVSSGQLGGMHVSPKGHVVATVANPARAPSRQAAKNMHAASARPYIPRIYPGRARPWEVHVWDEHGHILYEDAVPSAGRMDGILMDRDDNLYVVVAGVGRVNGRKYFNPISCSVFKMRPKTKIVSTRGVLALPPAARPQREPDVFGVDGAGDIWIEAAEWVRGGFGFDGKRRRCHCMSQSRPALDYFARIFLPEVDHYSVLVVDTNGNEVLRIGQYGNVDDGRPCGAPWQNAQKRSAGSLPGEPPDQRSIGGDEVAIMHAQMLAVHTDRRLFISDLGNQRILSVKLDYHSTETVALEDVRNNGN